MSTKHTAGKWSSPIWSGSDEFNEKADALGIARVPALTNDGSRYILANGRRIATVDCITEFKRGKGHETECAERDANAAFIVRAVNSHAELVGALHKAEQRIEQLCSTVNTLSNAQGLGNKVRADDFTDVIRAALSRAKGE